MLDGDPHDRRCRSLRSAHASTAFSGSRACSSSAKRRSTPEAEEALQAAIYACADRALSDLVAARRDEGRALTAILLERVDEIAALTKAAELHPGRGRDAILEKLRRQVEELTAASPALSEERLNAGGACCSRPRPTSARSSTG